MSEWFKSLPKPGDKFGYLTLVRLLKRGGFSDVQCACGKTKTVQTSYLIKGSLKSCGCMKMEGINKRPREYIRRKLSYGDTYGWWKVLGMSKIDRKKVRVLCICGVVKEIQKSNLVGGRIKSCGCARFKTGPKRPKMVHLQYENPFAHITAMHDDGIVDNGYQIK